MVQRNKQQDPKSQCAKCTVNKRICVAQDGRNPAFCPIANKPDIIALSLKEYEEPKIREFPRQASIQEADVSADRT